MRIAFLIGTRPEVIKISPAIRECQKRDIDFFIISSNQHYDDVLFKDFLKELGFPEIKYKKQGAFELHNCYIYLQRILKKEKPDYIWVGGDTDTSLVGAWAGHDNNIKVIHRESGVRSFDRRMHEEKNRIFIDKLSTIRFTPTVDAVDNLALENISDNVFHTGNLIADAIEQTYKFNRGGYMEPTVYMTIHRQENIEKFSRLRNMMENIIQSTGEILKIFPAHPKILNMARECWGDKLNIIDPVSYVESLNYIKNAEYVITDSGGIQEEACILGTPCVVLRKTSDRPETIKLGSAILIDPDSEGWKIKFKKKEWTHPYGKDVAVKMFNILEGI